MIRTAGFKREAFLSALAKRLTGDGNVKLDVREEVYYLGAGYWRAVPCVEGFRLVNPSLSSDQISIVEQAMGIILGT